LDKRLHPRTWLLHFGFVAQHGSLKCWFVMISKEEFGKTEKSYEVQKNSAVKQINRTGAEMFANHIHDQKSHILLWSCIIS